MAPNLELEMKLPASIIWFCETWNTQRYQETPLMIPAHLQMYQHAQLPGQWTLWVTTKNSETVTTWRDGIWGQEVVAAQPAAATPAGQLMMTSGASSSPWHHHYAAERFEESKTSTYLTCRLQTIQQEIRMLMKQINVAAEEEKPPLCHTSG